jgi:hypothetical protein
MSVTYTIHNEGHLVHAIASGRVIDKDLLGYEISIANDDRIVPGSDVVFEIKPDCVVTITGEGMQKVIERREALAKKRKSYRCAIVIPYKNRQLWETAQYYKKKNELKFPGIVTVLFSDMGVAGEWLGIEGSRDRGAFEAIAENKYRR